MSIAIGSVISSLIGFQGFLPYLISGLFALLLTFAMDYPFSVLSLKGVESIEDRKIVEVIIQKMEDGKNVLCQLSLDSHKRC